MVRTTLALVAAMAVVCARAEASRSYTFNTTSISASDGSRGVPLYVNFVISDAAIQRGNFSLSGTGAGNSFQTTGDVNDFTSITIGAAGVNEGISPKYLLGTIRTSLTFDPKTGNLLGESLNFLGVSTEASIGGGIYASGTVGSDTGNYALTGSRVGFVSGFFTVPEPTSFAMMAVGLLGLARLKRRVG